MATRQLSINDNQGHTLNLEAFSTTGVMVISKDLGAPMVRESTIDLPVIDGVDDRTYYYGQRVVNMTGIAGIGSISRTAAFDTLAPYLDPRARCTLTYVYDTGDPQARLITNMRPSQWSRVATNPQTFDWQIQWKADPIAVDVTQQSVTVTGTASITNAGTYDTWPIYRFLGAQTNPSITFAGSNVVFAGITVAAGDYLQVDTKARTAVRNSDGANVFGYLDHVNTQWTSLPPGTFTATASNCTVFWRNAYL